MVIEEIIKELVNEPWFTYVRIQRLKKGYKEYTQKSDTEIQEIKEEIKKRWEDNYSKSEQYLEHVTIGELATSLLRQYRVSYEPIPEECFYLYVCVIFDVIDEKVINGEL